jgi:23S rRNA pseudouridine1911/1915/1917 synthase
MAHAGPPILYEDDHLIVVDKPAGMIVHPTYKHPSGTLLDLLRSTLHWQDHESPSIVGRLDRLTSGIVVAARNAAAHAALQQSLASAATEKLYIAIVEGDVDEPRGSIELRLKVDPADRRRMIVAADGKPAVTHFERPSSANGCSLLHCRILTGRRHQIRVHLAARGWPVVGDEVYGTARAGFPRHALHAWRLTMIHPVTARQHRWQAEIPPELSSFQF